MNVDLLSLLPKAAFRLEHSAATYQRNVKGIRRSGRCYCNVRSVRFAARADPPCCSFHERAQSCHFLEQSAPVRPAMKHNFDSELCITDTAARRAIGTAGPHRTVTRWKTRGVNKFSLVYTTLRP